MYRTLTHKNGKLENNIPFLINVVKNNKDIKIVYSEYFPCFNGGITVVVLRDMFLWERVISKIFK